uniref:Putative salivary kunitz domain protein n=1 Tax=Ixodes ricinus TaxID=34613 RepID=A0A0K8RMT4_IXORI
MAIQVVQVDALLCKYFHNPPLTKINLCFQELLLPVYPCTFTYVLFNIVIISHIESVIFKVRGPYTRAFCVFGTSFPTHFSGRKAISAIVTALKFLTYFFNIIVAVPC